MSFRTRLVLFFVVIVVVPMLAVALMLFGLIGHSENGKSNAAIAARHDVAQQLLREQRDLARVAVEHTIASDRVLRSAFTDGDRRRAAKRARQLVKFRGIERIVLVRDGRTMVQAGEKTAIAPAIRPIESSTRRRLGRLEVSVIDARRYLRRVRQITGLQTVVHDGRTLLASTLPVRITRELGRDGATITVAGREYRLVSFGDPRPFTGQRLRVSTLGAIEGTDDRIREGRITAGLILLGFFVLAIACAVLLSIENVHLHETVAHESLTDVLTGLPNRRALFDALALEVERSKRYGTGVGLVLLDIDDFKAINDTTGGHQQGDVVLREVARVLRETSREVDHPARRGGDELAVVVPGTDLDGAFNFAERVRQRIGALRIARLDGQGELTVTTSCGVAAVPPIAADETALDAAADRALFQAKETGKNKTVRCDEARSD